LQLGNSFLGGENPARGLPYYYVLAKKHFFTIFLEITHINVPNYMHINTKTQIHKKTKTFHE